MYEDVGFYTVEELRVFSNFVNLRGFHMIYRSEFTSKIHIYC